MFKSRKSRIIAVAAAALLCLAAMASLNYILTPPIVDSGGGYATSSNYQLQGSIGKPVVAPTTAGVGTSSNYTLEVNVIGLIDPPAPAGGGGGGGGGGDDGGCAPGPVSASAFLPLMAVFLAMRRRR